MERKNDLRIIKNSIRTYYRTRYHWPLLYMTILLIMVFFLPIFSLIKPAALNSQSDLAVFKKHNRVYGEYTLPTVYFTGYTCSWMNDTKGYYYYSSINESIVILLLDPQTCEQGNPIIKDITFSGKLMKRGKAVDVMLSYLADDLEWTVDGIYDTVSPYMISEPDATGASTIAFKFVYIGTFLFALFAIFFHTLFYIFPEISPTILNLHRFGNPWEILEKAEEEIATLPQLASEDLFITQNYFIKLSTSGVAIVPIRYIIWIYKSPQTKQFLWHKYDITFTLHIIASKHHEIKCPDNSKSSIDGIIDYLSEANHNIISGYNEENRIRAQRIQNARYKRLLKKIFKTN